MLFLVGLKPAVDFIVDEGFFVGSDIVEEYFFDRVLPTVHVLTTKKYIIINDHATLFDFLILMPHFYFMLVVVLMRSFLLLTRF